MQSSHPASPQTTPQEIDQETHGKSIPTLFEEQVKQHPQRIAVTSREGVVTYAALNAAANSLAINLLHHATPASKPVALLLGHSASMLSAMIGTMKTGCFYVVLDPLNPPATLVALLEDSEAEALVTDSAYHTLALSVAVGKQRVVCLDELVPEASNPECEEAKLPERLAAMYYTSGSTGTPKAVLHTQASQLFHNAQVTKTQEIGIGDRLTLLTPFTFLISSRHIFCGLLAGATVCLYDLRQEGIIALVEWLKKEEISIFQSTTTVFRQLVQLLGKEEQLPHLRWISLGGETITLRDINLYKEHFSDNCRLRVTLAATETNFIAWSFVDKQTTFDEGPLPVGYPIDGVQVELWNEDGDPVASDQIGEIVVHGRFLSPGYWRQPQLTASVFVSAPNGGDERLYRTGDLGRLDAQGRLIHLGRKDFQVKIRGYRVEVAPIEAELVALDSVELATVVARVDASGGSQLVAYLVASQNPPPTVSELRHHLASRLPDYMVPSHFVMLETLPLTAAGKVDRLNLPKLSMQRPHLANAYIQPHTPLAQSLCALWATLLEIESVGVEDDFFWLGGDSILAMRLALRVEQQWQRSIPSTFFRRPTVANLMVLWEQENPTDELGEINDVEVSFDTTIPRARKALVTRVIDKIQKAAMTPGLRAKYMRWQAEPCLAHLAYPIAVRLLAWWSSRAFIRETLYRKEYINSARF